MRCEKLLSILGAVSYYFEAVKRLPLSSKINERRETASHCSGTASSYIFLQLYRSVSCVSYSDEQPGKEFVE